jgi:hypothetical protein
MLLDLSIILTLLVVGSSFTNEVLKRAEEASVDTRRHGHLLKKGSPAQRHSLDAAE